MSSAGIRRIFVRAPNWVGDAVMATAAFDRLRGAFPAAEIRCGLRPYLRPLLDGAGWFDGWLDAPRVRSLRELRRQVVELRFFAPDLAVVLPNSLETGLVAFLAGVPLRLGYRQGRPWMMTVGPKAQANRAWWSRRGPRRVPEPMPEYYARLLDRLGLPPGPQRTRLAVEPAAAAAVDRWVGERGLRGRRLVLVAAGASYGASKLWLPERFAAVAAHFDRRPDTAAVVLAGPAEVELAREISRRAGCVAAIDPVLGLAELKALVDRSAIMITTDTGPRHIAVAFDKAVVCLIGPTDPRYTNYSLARTVLLRRQLDCVPCQRKTCPLGHHDCMRGIEVDEVVAAGERLLAAGA